MGLISSLLGNQRRGFLVTHNARVSVVTTHSYSPDRQERDVATVRMLYVQVVSYIVSTPCSILTGTHFFRRKRLLGTSFIAQEFRMNKYIFLEVLLGVLDILP